jgi:hypothetical protein
MGQIVTEFQIVERVGRKAGMKELRGFGNYDSDFL